MSITFSFTTVDDEISVVITGLIENARYYYSVTALGRGELSWHEMQGGRKTPRTVHITAQLEDQPPGFYVFRLYDDAEMEDTTPPRPRVGATPEQAVFQYLPGPSMPSEPLPTPHVVRLDRTASTPTTDEVLSMLVLAATNARSFAAYKAYVDAVVCRPGTDGAFSTDAYRRLVRATTEFLEQVRGPIVDPGGSAAAYLRDGRLPYVDAIAQRFPDALRGDPCSDLDPDLLEQPFPVELIWSYWVEQAGLPQTLNHILARFQNRRVVRGRDPLAHFDLSPLRPLRHFLWEWAESEMSRLSVRRRNFEYQSEYGLTLVGRAIPPSGYLVEQRTRFLDAFHTLLYEAHEFFKEDDNHTISADAFPVSNALRDTHLVLAEGATNSFGDLPTQARVEMLIMQWIMSHPEIRAFLGGKPMVPYDEAWMPQVETMKALMGWTPISVTHFHELAVRGEQLLLTIRWGDWNSTAVTADSARNWARTWRNQIQRYVHAYRAVTGVDLTVAPDARQPGYLLVRQTADRNRRR